MIIHLVLPESTKTHCETFSVSCWTKTTSKPLLINWSSRRYKVLDLQHFLIDHHWFIDSGHFVLFSCTVSYFLVKGGNWTNEKGCVSQRVPPSKMKGWFRPCTLCTVNTLRFISEQLRSQVFAINIHNWDLNFELVKIEISVIIVQNQDLKWLKFRFTIEIPAQFRCIIEILGGDGA